MPRQKRTPADGAVGALEAVLEENPSTAIAETKAQEPTPMTRGEREDLQRLVKQREKVQKSAAKLRSAKLLADFENQMGAIFQPEDDPVWKGVEREARKEVEKAQRNLSDRCRELGIPRQFSPTLDLDWHHRGYGNALEKRRQELRVVAKTRIEAIESEAILQIELTSVEAQTSLCMSGLTSEAARAFVASLPTVESLMPALSFEAIAGPANPPVAEQLVSPNVLRQRRYRERIAQRNGDASVTSQLPAVTPPEEEGQA